MFIQMLSVMLSLSGCLDVRMVEELEPGVYDAWREEAASVLLQDPKHTLKPTKVLPLPAVVLQRNPALTSVSEPRYTLNVVNPA